VALNTITLSPPTIKLAAMISWNILGIGIKRHNLI
jgi:hypothetical protein